LGGRRQPATATHETAAGTCIQTVPVQAAHDAASAASEHLGQTSALDTVSQWLHSSLPSPATRQSF